MHWSSSLWPPSARALDSSVVERRMGAHDRLHQKPWLTLQNWPSPALWQPRHQSPMTSQRRRRCSSQMARRHHEELMGFRPILVLAPLKPRTTSSSRSTANAFLTSSLAKLLSCVSLMWSTPLFHCFSCNTSQRMVLLPTSWFPQMRIGRGSSKSNNWCISSCHSA